MNQMSCPTHVGRPGFVQRRPDLGDKNPGCVKFDVYCDLKTKPMQETMFPDMLGTG